MKEWFGDVCSGYQGRRPGAWVPRPSPGQIGAAYRGEGSGVIPELGTPPRNWPELPAPPELLPLPADSWPLLVMMTFLGTCSRCRGSRPWMCRGYSTWPVAVRTWAATVRHTHTQVGLGARGGCVGGDTGGATPPATYPLCVCAKGSLSLCFCIYKM